MQIVFNTLFWEDMLRGALPPLMSVSHACDSVPNGSQCSAARWDVLQFQQFLFRSFLTFRTSRVAFEKTGPFLVACFILTKELFPFICVSYMFTLYLTLPKRKTILNVLSLLFSKVSVSFVLRWGRSRDRVPLCGELPYCLWQPHYRWRHLSLFALLFKSD